MQNIAMKITPHLKQAATTFDFTKKKKDRRLLQFLSHLVDKHVIFDKVSLLYGCAVKNTYPIQVSHF